MVGLPIEVPLPSPKGCDRVTDACRTDSSRRPQAKTRQSCLVSERPESGELLVFLYPPERRVAGQLSGNFFEQFGSEVHTILASLRHLTEAEARRDELEVFIDRFKHAISSPLQGISDRILQLRAGLEGKKTLPYKRLRRVSG